MKLTDVQGLPDSRQLAINKVGVKALRHPLAIQQRDGQTQHTVATCNLYANLSAAQKGTHMSRFVEILNDFTQTLSYSSLLHLLERIKTSLDTQNSFIELQFPYFCRKLAPLSKVPSLLDYDVSLSATLGEHPQFNLKVIVPVTSLCPCSKEISQYGAHNQRSHITVTLFDATQLWIEDIIDVVEQHASCALYSILKRADEKYVTETAYENPKFVEDVVRDIAAAFNVDSRIGRYHVAAENFESIHNHSAYAEIDR